MKEHPATGPDGGYGMCVDGELDGWMDGWMEGQGEGEAHQPVERRVDARWAGSAT